LRLYASALVMVSLVGGLCSAGYGVASAAAAPADGGTTSATLLALSAPSAVYGDEQDDQLTVTVSGDGGTPTGTVAVSAGATTVCTITLAADGTGSCALTPDEFPVGPVTLSASYSGDPSFDPSDSPTASLQVVGPPPPPPPAAAPTTTTLGLSATALRYGDEQAEKVSVTVGSPAGTPTGQVTVKAGGTTIRVISLTSGKGAYTLAPGTLAVGTVKLTASYAGDAGYAPSSSAPKSLTVARTSSSTTLGLSAAKVTYGAEQRMRISVAVRPAYGVPPGRVMVKAGSAVICVITLRSAKGACSPTPARLAAGRHQITAVYGGGGDVASSASAARTLVVAVASSKTTLSVSAATVTYGRERSEKISVRVAPRYAGTPGGTVTVKANGVTLTVIRLKSGGGSYTFSANRLRAGGYSLAATYSGNADFGRSVSAKRSLRVASPPPPPAPPAACHPHSSSGKCYEPGEYCSEADHGVIGLAGDGKTIICEDNNGWRWEPLS
jgi:hypothetical protein